MSHILEVNDLVVQIKANDETFDVVNGVSFSVDKGQILGIVGESGCGKTMTVRSIINLLPSNASVTAGSILMEGKDLCTLKKREMQKIRGKKIAMIFQEPMASLNPVYSIAAQMTEMIRLHTDCTKEQAFQRAVHMLEHVGIPRANEVIHEYPYQLSGGMCQRVMIAMAMSCDPELLIADEPTTALDVTIQAQIMELMKKLQREKQMSILLITHDLGVVAETCQNVIVMYAGEVVEKSAVTELFRSPKHPYTQALLESIPSLDVKREFLPYIKGTVPRPQEMPRGCRFAPRCEQAKPECFEKKPPLFPADGGSEVRCWIYRQNEADGR